MLGIHVKKTVLCTHAATTECTENKNRKILTGVIHILNDFRIQV